MFECRPNVARGNGWKLRLGLQVRHHRMYQATCVEHTLAVGALLWLFCSVMVPRREGIAQKLKSYFYMETTRLP